MHDRSLMHDTRPYIGATYATDVVLFFNKQKIKAEKAEPRLRPNRLQRTKTACGDISKYLKFQSAAIGETVLLTYLLVCGTRLVAVS